MIAMSYGNIYVAGVAMGASDSQTVRAFLEAESYDGPSLIIAYSHCIMQGIDTVRGMEQQKLAVESAYWPLYRYDPTMRRHGVNPFRLDSPRPRLPLEDYRYREVRFKVVEQTRPAEARRMLEQARAAVMERYRFYEDLAARDGSRFEQSEPGR